MLFRSLFNAIIFNAIILKPFESCETMNRIFKIILFSVFVIIYTSTKAQTSTENIDSLAGRFIKDLRAGTTEKLLAHTNKTIFKAGEELWFKAWIVNSLSHKYFTHSKTLYADLVNEKDSAVSQLLLNIPSERTEGKIKLSDSLKEGYYWLRLYTATIQRYDTSSILVVPIYVVNKKFPSTFISTLLSLLRSEEHTS